MLSAVILSNLKLAYRNFYMFCGYGDKLFASSGPHLQAFSLRFQVQRDHRQRSDPFFVTEDQ